jgi:hypothetical protein
LKFDPVDEPQIFSEKVWFWIRKSEMYKVSVKFLAYPEDHFANQNTVQHVSIQQWYITAITF